MIFLSQEEGITLQKILIERSMLTTAQAELRRALLINCKLGKYSGNLVLAPTVQEFVIKLCAALSNMPAHPSKEMDLVIFLRYLRGIDNSLAEQDQEFLDHVIKKGGQWHEFTDQGRRRATISELWDQADQEQAPSKQSQERVKIDKEVVVGFNLRTMMAQFAEEVDYEGAFSFVVGGDAIILEYYIIERMLRELKHVTERSHARFDIRLYPDDIPNNTIEPLSIIEHKLAVNQISDKLPHLFAANPNVNIVLIVWNYYIPPLTMKTVAESFWAIVRHQISPSLKNQRQCFVIIWANLGPERLPIDGSILLATPSEFKLAEVRKWHYNLAEHLKLEEAIRERYLNRLKSQNGHVLGTYQEMQVIVQELQRGVMLYE